MTSNISLTFSDTLPSTPSTPSTPHYHAADSKPPAFVTLHSSSNSTPTESTPLTLLYTKSRTDFDEKTAPFLVILRRTYKPEFLETGPKEYAKWFEEEHVRLIEEKIGAKGGWRRSRAFRSGGGNGKEAGENGKGEAEYFTIHEYDHLEDMKSVMGQTKGLASPWKEKVDGMLSDKSVREWELVRES